VNEKIIEISGNIIILYEILSFYFSFLYQPMAHPIEQFQHLPKFPDGRIDYTDATKAPVINCFLQYQDEILLLKRGKKVGNYQGKRNSIAGYIDDSTALLEKAKQEVREEVCIGEDDIAHIIVGSPLECFDEEIGKTRLIYPFIFQLKTKVSPKLDREHTTCQRVKQDELTKYDIVKDLDKTLESML
jgi:predicted NUDIX family phosphoesterase